MGKGQTSMNAPGPVRAMRLVIASGNRKKTSEIRVILAAVPFLLVSDLNDYPPLPEPAETGRTFAENARIKARYYARRLCQAVLAEDSGLSVAALDGRPGIHSARFAGPGRNDRDNIRLLLKMMTGAAGPARTACFISAACLLLPGEKPRVFEGRRAGMLTERPRGTRGFGYDPVFLLPEKNLTFAELAPEEKNRLSHRREALEKVRTFLLERQGVTHGPGPPGGAGAVLTGPDRR